MFSCARSDEIEIAGRGLRITGIWASRLGRVGGREEGVGEERRRVRGIRDRGAGRGEGVAGHENIGVGGAAAFCRDDVRVVGQRDFVDDADEGLAPSVFVVWGRVGRWLRRFGVGRWWGPVAGVGEAGFAVGDPGQVEGQGERGHEDVEGGEGADAASGEESDGGEVGAVGEVEDCRWVWWGRVISWMGERRECLIDPLLGGAWERSVRFA